MFTSMANRQSFGFSAKMPGSVVIIRGLLSESLRRGVRPKTLTLYEMKSLIFPALFQA